MFKDQQMIYSWTACMEICGEVSIVNFTLIHPNKPNKISQWNFNLNQNIHEKRRKRCDGYIEDLKEATGASVEEEGHAESLKQL